MVLQNVIESILILTTCVIGQTYTHDVVIENVTGPWVDIKPKDMKEKIFLDHNEELHNLKTNHDHNDNKSKVNKKSIVENETDHKKDLNVSKNQSADNVTNQSGPQESKAKPRRIITPIFEGIGPSGLADEEATTCDEFSSYARFNPHSVVDEKYFCFYNWGADNTPLILQFRIPTSEVVNALRKVLDPQVAQHPIDWDAPKVLMTDMMYNATALLIERGDRGQYWLYPYIKSYDGVIEPSDVRLKQTGDNKYLAFMECLSERVYVLSRLNDIPPQKKLQNEAAKVGYRGRGGRSYLYQGHQWMPIPEMDELEYWAPPNFRKDQHVPEPIEEEDPHEGVDPRQFFY